jgi:hypothetical protein
MYYWTVLSERYRWNLLYALFACPSVFLLGNDEILVQASLPLPDLIPVLAPKV